MQVRVEIIQSSASIFGDQANNDPFGEQPQRRFAFTDQRFDNVVVDELQETLNRRSVHCERSCGFSASAYRIVDDRC